LPLLHCCEGERLMGESKDLLTHGK